MPARRCSDRLFPRPATGRPCQPVRRSSGSVRPGAAICRGDLTVPSASVHRSRADILLVQIAERCSEVIEVLRSSQRKCHRRGRLIAARDYLFRVSIHLRLRIAAAVSATGKMVQIRNADAGFLRVPTNNLLELLCGTRSMKI